MRTYRTIFTFTVTYANIDNDIFKYQSNIMEIPSNERDV